MSKEIKGILTPEMESKVSQYLDDIVKLEGILEAIDGLAFKLVITQLDNNFADRIPEPYKTEIREVLSDILMDNDYNSAINKGLALLDSIIDIPMFDDESEALIFEGLASILIAILAKIKV
jgi:hypothetical protein